MTKLEADAVISAEEVLKGPLQASTGEAVVASEEAGRGGITPPWVWASVSLGGKGGSVTMEESEAKGMAGYMRADLMAGPIMDLARLGVALVQHWQDSEFGDLAGDRLQEMLVEVGVAEEQGFKPGMQVLHAEELQEGDPVVSLRSGVQKVVGQSRMIKRMLES